MVLVTFYRRGVPFRKVTLGELFPDLGVLEETTSHYRWGSVRRALDARQRFFVNTVDGRILAYDATTGLRLEESAASERVERGPARVPQDDSARPGRAADGCRCGVAGDPRPSSPWDVGSGVAALALLGRRRAPPTRRRAPGPAAAR